MPAINKPNQHFDVLTWSGTGGGSGATRSITGLNFQPDLIWEKARTSGSNHQLLDSVRGVGQNKVLASNSTGAEPTPANTESLYGWLSAINSDGFTLTNGTSTFDNWNKSGDTYVGWTWKAGGTAVTNTTGTISSQVSANPTAGFSVVTWTGNATSGATVGHGLGVAPSFLIFKNRSGTDGWIVFTQAITATTWWDTRLLLASTAAAASGAGYLTSAPTSTLLTLSSSTTVNASSNNYVAYCFAPVAGYSAFGSYTGNGSTDGPFVYLGFRPRWILIRSTTAARDWLLYDTSRLSYNNGAEGPLQPNLNGTAYSSGYFGVDILSNGFKLRESTTNLNANGETMIYAAFAENPFKYANAR